MAAYSVVSVSAETTFGISAGSYADGCVIPESGPWPPCATGGTGSGDSTASGNACPASGKWPPGCVPGGSGGSGGDAASAPGQPCPTSGAWPAGCVPNGGGDSGGGTTPAPGQPCPASGAWPAGCVPTGGGAGSSPAPAPTPAPTPSVSIAQIERRIILARQQLEDYWLTQFQQWGISYQPPALVQLYVGGEDDPPNAFFVPASNAIFIDLRLLTEIAQEYGEYGAVAVLAHEWAHFIQDELDLLSGRSLRQIELQADCFSGSFTNYLNSNGLLGGGEYEGARDLFFSIGDDQINPDAPYNQPGAHGTGTERQTAFVSGWTGDANSCRNSYNQ